MTRKLISSIALALLLLALPSPLQAQTAFARQFPNYSLTLQSTDAAGNAHFHIVWNDATAVDFQVFGIHYPQDPIRFHVGAFGNDRLFFSTEDSSEFFVVNPRTGQLVDNFNVGIGAIASDSRFIVAGMPTSRGAPDQSAVYVAYDLALTPAQNRMGNPAPGADGLYGHVAGWALYPPENRTTQSYSSSSAVQGSFHSTQSPFFWIGNRTLAFLDRSDGALRAVLVRFGETMHDFQVDDRVVDATSVIDAMRLESGTTAAEYLRVTWIGLASNTSGSPILRLTFPSDDAKYTQWSLDIPF